MSEPRVSVGVASVRPGTLQFTIDSILQQRFSDWELIVVGQGEDTVLKALGERAATVDGRIRYVHSQAKGLSLARNIVIRHARGDVIAMTDDDCEAREDWLEAIVSCFDKEPETALVGGVVRRPAAERRFLATCPGLEPPEVLYDPVATGRHAPDGWGWIGANFAFRKQIVELVGYFDECLGPGAVFPIADDTDYKLRLERLGLRMRSTPRSVVFHTYGWRYGLRAVVRNLRNYAQGNGGLAGKLTLLGDPRGEAWLQDTRRDCIAGPLRNLRLHRLPRSLLRLKNYSDAYHHCLRDFQVDGEAGVLYPRRGWSLR